MITLDQIKQLDHKVRNAIDKISTLKSDNSMLQEKLDNCQLRIEELEVLIDTFKEDQGEIERGIIDALNQLDILEDNIVRDEVDSEPKKESGIQPDKDSNDTEVTSTDDDDDEQDDDDEDSDTTEVASAEEEESDEKDSEDSSKEESELDIF